jgi:hypothetical protein
MIGFPAIIILDRFAILNGACYQAPGCASIGTGSGSFPRVPY